MSTVKDTSTENKINIVRNTKSNVTVTQPSIQTVEILTGPLGPSGTNGTPGTQGPAGPSGSLTISSSLGPITIDGNLTLSGSITISGSGNVIISEDTGSFITNSQTSSMTVLSSSFATTASFISSTFISSSAAASGFGSGGGGSTIDTGSLGSTTITGSLTISGSQTGTTAAVEKINLGKYSIQTLNSHDGGFLGQFGGQLIISASDFTYKNPLFVIQRHALNDEGLDLWAQRNFYAGGPSYVSGEISTIFQVTGSDTAGRYGEIHLGNELKGLSLQPSIKLIGHLTASAGVHVSASSTSTASFGTYLGDGSQLTGISAGSSIDTGSLGSTTITGSLTVSGSNTFTNIGSFSQTGDAQITGSLTVSGSSTGIQLESPASSPGDNSIVRLGSKGTTTSNGLEIYTNSGYLQIGPQNSTYSHFYTDRGRFYFNKAVYVQGNLYSVSQDFVIGRNNGTSDTIRLGDNSIKFDLNSTNMLFISSSHLISGSSVSTASFGTYLGDGSQLTGISAGSSINTGSLGSTTITGSLNVSGSITTFDINMSTWTLGADGGSNYYYFTGPGDLGGTEQNPDIHLTRGQKYRFYNPLNAHPFQIQDTGGSAFSTGVTNNGVQLGFLSFDVPMDGPTHLLYQCTSHAAMKGNIYIADARIASGSFSGSFQGDGSELTNIPASGITGLNLSQIASGSATASISPNKGFVVNTTISGSIISGSNGHFTGTLKSGGDIDTAGSISVGFNEQFTVTTYNTNLTQNRLQLYGGAYISGRNAANGSFVTIDTATGGNSFGFARLGVKGTGLGASQHIFEAQNSSGNSTFIISNNGHITSSANISSSAASTASFGTYLGDGSQLTGISSGGGTSTMIASGSTSASADPGTGIVVNHSGSTAFSVIGDVGTLFSVDDSLTGTLFSANDISGFPVLQADSTGEVYLGKTPQSLYTTAVISSTTAATTHSLVSLSTSSYDGAFFEYTAISSSNARAGSIMSVWNGANIVSTETTSSQIGNTTDLTAEVIISQSQAQLVVYGANASYKVKTIIKAI